MPLSNTELNRIGDNIVAQELSSRIHTADPGANGTANRIGTVEATLAASNWSNASNGDVTYTPAVNYGVVDSGSNRTVAWYSLWRGSDFVLRRALASSVSVTAGGTFSINAGTIAINGMSST